MTERETRHLAERMGPEQLAHRQQLQRRHRMRLCGTNKFCVSLRTIHIMHRIINVLLRMTGLHRPGYRNAMDLQVEQHEIRHESLPPAFDGFRILHISDVHIDSNPALLEVLQEKISGLSYDLCIFTGDYREEAAGHFETPVRMMKQLCATLHAPAYAVLGNHDAVEMVPLLEDEHFTVLLNEQAVIERDGEKLCIIGVDDPYYYETDHLEKAANGVPEDSFCILLAHSPEIAAEASDANMHLYLCGHTHGGQICLPGGTPVMANSRCAKAQRKGLWKHGNMIGYTSRGAGTSSVDVRFNCPPEITIHTLRSTGN